MIEAEARRAREPGSASGSAACIHELFAAQAARTPHRAAVVSDTASLTYRELDRRANALAHDLVRRGGRQDTLIGLHAERSVEMVVGLLGILKAGAAYVPLDPAYPAARLRFMARDSALKLAVCQGGLEHGLPSVIGTTVTVDAARGGEENVGPHNGAGPDNLAYVVYTSGSTGQPKGVLVEHRGVCNLVASTVPQLGIGADDRILQFASFGFDISVWEIFAALVGGATLVIGDRHSLAPGPSLRRLLQRHRVSIAVLSPSVLQVLPADGLPDLRIVIASAEKCTAAVVDRWARGRKFYNAYGPTETTVFATIAECHAPAREAPSIGRAIRGLTAHVLDEERRPVQAGAPGELFIGGVGLARGYLNRPELTAERFVENPFGAADGSPRLYRTGDRARFRPDGDLEFLGRLDQQVKVRGFRIEPGEIEAALDAHPCVERSVVVPREEVGGQTQLVAYLVCRPGQSVESRALRQHLEATLPAFMLPGQFVYLDRWPLTPNGKLDRDRLPAPGATLPTAAAGEEGAAPGETTLLTLCRRILGIDELGPHDNLLDFGFHSLSAAQLAWQVADALHVELPLSAVFEAPTVAELAARLASAASTAAASYALAPVPAREEYPLTPAQERVWFLEQLHPGNNAYRVQAVFRISGRLDIVALTRSLSEMLRRHEILRTTFHARAGGPIQRVHGYSGVTTPFQLVDLNLLPQTEREKELQALIEQEIRAPFELTQLPLIRWTLFGLGPQEHVLLHTEHHLLHDAWSYCLFLREVFAIYCDLVTAAPASLPEPDVQFAALACWQRDPEREPLYGRQVEHWKRMLTPLPPVLDLPSDRARPGQPSFRGNQLRAPLSGELMSRLTAACRAEGVTPFMWLFAALATLLSRYSGESEVCIGTGFANRRSCEAEQLLGMVINTVALPVDVSGDPSFREVLQRVRAATLEAADHQDVPFERVVKAVSPERHADQSPLFRVFFSSYDAPFPRLELPGAQVSPTHVIGNGSAKFDLTVLVIPYAEGPSGRDGERGSTLIWEYSTDLFDSLRADSMLGDYQTLIAESLTSPGRRASELDTVTAPEREALIEMGQGPRTQYPRDRCVHELFEAQARRSPGATAIVAASTRLSYRELDEAANRLAHELRAKEIGPGKVVAILLDRSADRIVAFLGVLKAGAAYLAIDVNEPVERRDRIVADARASLVLTDERRAQLMAGAHRTAAPANEAKPQDLAYLCYTSGSTGDPKGVEIPHRAITRLLFGVDYARFGPDTAFLHLAPAAFDASLFEIWGALLHGGRCVLYPNEPPTCEGLARIIRDEQVTTAWLTASLFHAIVDESPGSLAGLQQLLTGGEEVSADHVRRAYQALSDIEIVNGYGPTESTTFAATYRIPRAMPSAARSLPIGRPIANTRCYVLSANLKPVRVGIEGELFIGGDGLARGYLGNEALTAARFVPDAVAGPDGGRLYRTGDRVRWRPDGTLDFVGRSDDQVKIRGYRVELGEVEEALLLHPAVRECAVVARRARGGGKALLACVVGPSGSESDRAELHKWLQQRLPAYMHPGALIFLPAMPLTPSGKIDREALVRLEPVPEPERTGPRAAASIREEIVLQEMERLLEVESLGVDDDFFSAGGHSLLALRLVARLSEQFGIAVPLRALFEAPSAAGLAAFLEGDGGERAERESSSLLPIRRSGDLPPLFLAPGGDGEEGAFLVYARLARLLRPEQPIYGLLARGRHGGEPHTSVEEMAGDYIREMRSVQEHGPYYLAGECVGGVIAYEMAQQLAAAGEKVGLVVILDGRAPDRWRFWRHHIWYLCTRVRFHLDEFRQRPAARGARRLGPLREWLARKVSDALPFDEVKAPATVRKAWVRYQKTLLRYRPRPYAGPVTLVLSEEVQRRRDPSLGWGRVVQGGLVRRVVPGTHHTYVREHANAVSAELARCLERAQAPRSSEFRQ